MQLHRVTITGADDSTDIQEMMAVSRQYPFVEWGILVSKSNTVNHKHEHRPYEEPSYNPRWPSMDWQRMLVLAAKEQADTKEPFRHPHFAVHACGSMIFSLINGESQALDIAPAIHISERVQLNFHGQPHTVSRPSKFVSALLPWNKRWIFQADGVNNHLCEWAFLAGLKAEPLHDKSHGAGILTGFERLEMPAARYGYAGGLGPDNVTGALQRISQLHPGNDWIWIDMETKVRTEDDSRLDMSKVCRVLEQCEPFVTK